MSNNKVTATTLIKVPLPSGKYLDITLPTGPEDVDVGHVFRAFVNHAKLQGVTLPSVQVTYTEVVYPFFDELECLER